MQGGCHAFLWDAVPDAAVVGGVGVIGGVGGGVRGLGQPEQQRGQQYGRE